MNPIEQAITAELQKAQKRDAVNRIANEALAFLNQRTGGNIVQALDVLATVSVHMLVTTGVNRQVWLDNVERALFPEKGASSPIIVSPRG